MVARNNILVLQFGKLLTDRCGYLTNEPVIDESGWSRETKIGNCTSNVAVEFRKANLCNLLSGFFNDTGVMFGECILNYAITTGDVLACELAGMPKSRGFCKAKVTNDWTKCREITCDISCTMESLETQQDLCIQWVAIEKGNMSLCNEIKSDAYNMKEICINMTLN